MSLPPGFLDELRSRLSLSQVAGRKVVWDARKSNQAKGDMWSPCPFHQEKTASFHVDDRKGYYYCFGCHAKGDAITFVRETENVNFMEAVEILAREAGMTMPARDPKAQEKADKRTELADVMEEAVKFFRLQLRTGAAGLARDYLEHRRGLGQAAQDRWELGFAPNAWQALWAHLKGKGIADQLILDAGLAKPSQKGGRPYDTFRDRIMFPIRDPRGRCIAFGGRAMDPNDGAKYLNSPETLLFDKSRTLFNHGPARTAAGKGQPLIVAEGYMDVIALAEHGFEAAVAPLGTAVTETQLQMLWRIAPEPIMALDGDTAGLRAAMRVIDNALPLLEAGQSLRFALMPDGQDPDDLLKAAGATGLQKVLDAALPMVRLLWQRETDGQVFDSPERKAALDKALREKIKLIKDPSIRQHYGTEIKDLRWQLFAPKRGNTPGRRAPQRQASLSTTKSSALAGSADPQVTDTLREAVIFAVAITTPDCVDGLEHQIENMPCRSELHARLRDLILRHALDGAEVLREKIISALGPETVENLLRERHVSIVPCVRNPGDKEMARMTMAEELAKLDAAQGLAAEIADAEEDMAGTADEGTTWRLKEAARVASNAQRSGQEDTAEYDVAENGAPISRKERDSFAALMDQIQFAKPRR
ncbi:MAG: DNA primase [Rhodobacteraceae bacterium]|nr:DNA primase [Paracoccaceae bacterium]